VEFARGYDGARGELSEMLVREVARGP
jgi:hypothetical protein